jgi:hypothetical protein
MLKAYADCLGVDCFGVDCFGVDCFGVDCFGVDCFGVDCSTLGRRFQGVTRPKQEVSKQQQNLSPQQEYELVCYMKGLTKQGLPPTRAIIQNFGSEVVGLRGSDGFVMMAMC